MKLGILASVRVRSIGRLRALERLTALIFLTSGVSYAAGDKLYWTDAVQPNGNCKVRCANLDGSNPEILVSDLGDLRGMAVDSTGGRIYWCEVGGSPPRIRSARLDGSDVRDVLVLTNSTSGVAVDSVGGKLYWAEAGYGGQTPQIGSADLDGTNPQYLPIAGLTHPVAVAVDHAGGQIYWSDVGTSQITRASLTGTGVQVVVPNTLGDVNGLTLDLVSGKIYWCVIPQPIAGDGSVQCANLDGSQQQTIYPGLLSPTSPAVDPVSGKVYWTESSYTLTRAVKQGSTDGSSLPVLISSLGLPWGIALGSGAPSTRHYYRFENGPAGIPATAPESILDSALAAAHGTPQGGPTYLADVPVNPVMSQANTLSLAFDGVDDAVAFHSPFIFHAQFSDATIEFWMKAPVQNSNDILWTTGGPNDANRFHLYTATAGCIGLDYRDNSGNIRTLLPNGAFPYPLDTWTNVAITRTVEPNGDHTYRFFSDGTLVHTATDTNPALPDETTWTIAGRPGYQGFIGQLDEIRMSDVALPPGDFLYAQQPSTYCTAKTNSLGCIPAISFSGLPTMIGPDNFYVTASNIMNLKSGMMLWSGAPASTPFHGGVLCLAPPIVRTPVQNSGGSPTGSDCTGTFSYHFTQSYMSMHFLGAGSHVCCQFWCRDPGFAAPNSIGLTDGLKFVIGP